MLATCRMVVLWMSFATLLMVANSTTFAQGYAPDVAAQKMTVADGFQVKLVASEPLVRQPVCIEFDDRGRLWVIQYLQYPNPAGLKRVSVDRYSRTVYDRVPDPPPKGEKGADRITILEDTDGDGRMDRGKDFVNGLNLASGLAFGHGGVYVLNVPYLLFYSDRNRDDVPDGDPEVLLTGFGMEDAHSVANSLTWGPDGWLYGCQGSTVTAKIRGIEFQQGVWRYHPLSGKFELFCEGGGNSWGLDFDRAGNLFYSTNWGGHVLLHGVQGGYYLKSFAKHGALHNPYAYGYFEHAPHQNFKGGHVTVGGIVYQGDSFPEKFRGKYIAGDLLGHGVYWHDIQPHGSTFKTAHGGELLVANDTWFAPSDVTMGPEGAVYVADWHDARMAHPDPDAEWDRSNGRIYKIKAVGTKSAAGVDFAKLSTEELIKLLDHRSQWYVRKARQELATRRDGKQTIALRERALNDDDPVQALEALWALHATFGISDPLAERLMQSPHPAVRSWIVRLLGDAAPVSTEIGQAMCHLAEREESASVRAQLACTAGRLSHKQAVGIVRRILTRDEDRADPFIPLLLWWTVERNTHEGTSELLPMLELPEIRKSKLASETIFTRLMRRGAASGTHPPFQICDAVLQAVEEADRRAPLFAAMLQGWSERDPAITKDLRLTESLRGTTWFTNVRKIVIRSWEQDQDNMTLLRLAVSLAEYKPALRYAMNVAKKPANEVARRAAMLDAAAEAIGDYDLPTVLAIVENDASETVRLAAVRVLSRHDKEEVAKTLLSAYPKSPPATQSLTREVLFSRKSSAKSILLAVESGQIAAAEFPIEQVRTVALHKDPELDALVTKHWGKLQSATREEKLAEVRRLNNDLRAAAGNAAAGHALYKKHCATCHQLFGEGTKLGPDLTTANRKDKDYLLVSLVDPSVVIRKEYLSYVVQTVDGRTLTGMLVERNADGVTLANAKNERTNIPASQIEAMEELPISLMPEDLYRQFKPQELRDLFAYLMSEGGK